MLLNDGEIYALLRSIPPLIPDAPVSPQNDYSKDSWVQPASLDLHVGKIYVPETGTTQSGGVSNPKTNHILEAGHTVVLETQEVIDLPGHIAGIGFPPSHIAAKGMLTTNPGHVDPGYKGHLSLTIINMGRSAQPIRNGDMILTLLLFGMSRPAESPYSARAGNSRAASVELKDRMSSLSKDFLQVEQRAKKAAKKAAGKTRWFAIVVPALIALIALIGTLAFTYIQNNSGLAAQVQRQETQIAVLRQQISDIRLRQRIVGTKRQSPASYGIQGHRQP